MTDVPRPFSDALGRLAASRRAFGGIRAAVEAGEPWPLAPAFGTEPEASWGPREVLAHTAEMLPYWLGEWERVVEAGRTGGHGQAFGRVAADPVRIAILERDRTLPLRELFDRIDAGIARWEARLAAASPADSTAVGAHARLGEMSAAELLERFVLGHLEEHAAQLVEGVRAS